MSLTRFFYDPFDEFNNFFGEGYDPRFAPSYRRRGGMESSNTNTNTIARPFAPKYVFIYRRSIDRY